MAHTTYSHEEYTNGVIKAAKFFQEHPEIKGPAQLALEKLVSETSPATLEKNTPRINLLDEIAKQEKEWVIGVVTGGAEFANRVQGDLGKRYVEAGLVKDIDKELGIGGLAGYQLEQKFTRKVASALAEGLVQSR